MFNLDELGLVSEFWAFICLLVCLDFMLCGFFPIFAEMAVPRSNLDYPFFHGRNISEAFSAFWTHPVWSDSFPCALHGLFNCFFVFFLMENSEPGSSLQSADEPIILGLMHHFFC